MTAGLLLGSVLLALCTLSQGLTVSNFEQHLDLRTQLATLTEVVSFKDAAQSIVMCYPVKYYENAALIKFTLDGNKKTLLKYAEVDAGQPHNHTCVEVQLGKTGGDMELESTLIMARMQAPTPAVIAQNQDQLVTFEGAVHAVSPYAVASQRLLINLQSKDVKEHSKTHPVSISGSRLIYGPYTPRAPFTAPSPLSLRFRNHAPFLAIDRLDRDIVVSHWGRVTVEERYSMRHVGAALSKHFSRFSYMSSALERDVPSVSQLSFTLPGAARYLYFKDTIGNISSSNVRHSAAKTVLLARPRFPLMGGWRTEFTIGYSLPLASVMKARGAGSYAVSFAFVSPLDLAYYADEINTNVILPEGSTSLKVDSGALEFSSVEQSSTYTYLDTFGRPTLRLHKRNVVKEHHQTVRVLYSFNDVYLFQEPFLVSAAVFALFVLVMAFSRLDLTIAKGPEWHAAQLKRKQANAVSGLGAVIAAFNKSLAAMTPAADLKAAGVGDAQEKAAAAKAAAQTSLAEMKSLHEHVSGILGDAATQTLAVHDAYAALLVASEKLTAATLTGVASGLSVADARVRLADQAASVWQLQADAAALATALLSPEG